MSRSTAVLGVFCKWPAPGAVKTRLGAGDADVGVRIATAFLLDTVERFAALAGRRVLVFSPIEARAGFAGIAQDRFDLQLQSTGDLGRRMSKFFDDEFAGGASAVVLIGTDSPTLPAEFIERAFTELQSADVVLGPATDGGYYLIGCRGPVPPIFDGVDWGTSSVLAQTITLLGRCDRRLAVLPPWYDVDTAENWAMLAGHVAAMRRTGLDPGVPHTELLIREFGPALNPPRPPP